MSIAKRRKRLLDDKETFFLWVELGSLGKVLKHYESIGIINPKTGNSFSETAIWTSALRYVLANPDEARPYYNADGEVELTDDEWEEWMLTKVFSVYNNSKSRTIKWAKKLGIFEKYYDIFAERFNLPER